MNPNSQLEEEQLQSLTNQIPKSHSVLSDKPQSATSSRLATLQAILPANVEESKPSNVFDSLSGLKKDEGQSFEYMNQVKESLLEPVYLQTVVRELTQI